MYNTDGRHEDGESSTWENGKEETYSTVDTFAESTFADVLERWGDAVRPDEFVDVETLLVGDDFFVRYEILNNKHLYFHSTE